MGKKRSGAISLRDLANKASFTYSEYQYLIQNLYGGGFRYLSSSKLQDLQNVLDSEVEDVKQHLKILIKQSREIEKNEKK